MGVVLCPGLFPAHNHGTDEMTGTVTYTAFANMLQWPIGVIPVTKVQEGEDVYPKKLLPSDQQDEIANVIAKQMKGSVGMPVGVQILARPFRDELCLYAMNELEQAL